MRLLVTGGLGFIGSNFVRLVLAERPSWSVVNLDAVTYAGNPANLEDVADDPRYRFIKGDVTDPAAAAGAMADCDAVAHFAAESHVDRSILSAEPFVRTNVLGTLTLLDAARARPGCRFVQISTDEVYGSLGTAGAFSETTAYAPNSPYAASKAAADHLVRAYHETYGLPTLITNCSNNYGPYQYPEKLIPLMVMNAVEGRPLPIYGDGGNVRDWLYVEDHCDGILAVLDRGRPGEKYNIGGDSERTNLEVVDSLCAALEAALPAATNPALTARGAASYRALRTFVPDRPGHDRRYAIDATKIRAELGWRPAHGWSAGLARTVRWYLEHRDWCATVLAGRYERERLGLRTGATG